MARTMNEKIEVMEKELERAKIIARIYNEVKENMQRTTGKEYRNPDTGNWEFFEYTEDEMEKKECLNPFTGEVSYIWDSKEEIKELKDIYEEVLDFLVKLA